MISSRHLLAIPGIDDLRRITQSIALLDAIIRPDWEFRYYSFNSKWSDKEMMASMRDGGGTTTSYYFVLMVR